MSEHREKLVEQIALDIETVATYRDHEVELAAEGAAMSLIALILAAVRDGRLRLPGEVGRGEGRSSHFGTGLNIARVEGNFVILYSCEMGTPLTLIALEGIGKQEEG